MKKKPRKNLSDELFREYKLVKSYLTKLADNNSMSDEEISSLLVKVEESQNNIDGFVATGGLESCPGDCNSERQACQSKCRESGKRFCGCFISAVGCGLCCFVGCQEATEEVSITTLFEVDEPIPLELINIPENDNDPIGQFYYSELKILSDNSVEISLKDVDNCKDEFLKLVYDPNGNVQVEGSSNSEVNSFALDNYSAWCGRWHRGRRNYWRLCGGGDCHGTGHRWCIKKVDREFCELTNTCPTN